MDDVVEHEGRATAEHAGVHVNGIRFSVTNVSGKERDGRSSWELMKVVGEGEKVRGSGVVTWGGGGARFSFT